ncbi:surface antigen-like protein [Leptomonas pyrrhocoris]|uniref:Surface antigen-like protein n=1 Tax=Leptomonas pyrrhocoris TaxID=157538 RepID=A0A0M9FWR3_LEPPY|nr:surface antigen-like protein [Leptomonas pyrrhocoris]KPA77553.1 surface antigen-like protein [Leptomonas pyrrhocoris]|eukprot:XP_015655992.1 surface antigen-like protein [Leptomonas pyrrhocoris]
MLPSLRRLTLAAALTLVGLLCTSAPVSVAAALTPAQQTNTLAFLQLMASSIPGLSSSWTGSDWCSWTYVSCAAESNITLLIDGANFSGSLPALTPNVTGANVALHTIALMNMNITSGFPASWAALSALKVLNLRNMNVFGSLPREWNAIAGLTSLSLVNTSACGGLPDWTFPAMENLDLSSNYLRGTLPKIWGAMRRLQFLNISYNYLCGCIPETWEPDVLQYAAIRSLGYYATDPKCRNTPACLAVQGCSRVVPNYGDVVATPTCIVVAALTLAAVVAAALFAP